MSYDFKQLLKCTVGENVFALMDYTWKSEPIIETGVGRTGTRITIQGDGWIEADTAADLSAAIASWQSNGGVSGVDVAIHGLGQLEAQVLAADCDDGGPHVGLEILSQLSGQSLRKEVRFNLSAVQKWSDGGLEDQGSHWSEQSSYTPDGQVRIRRSGECRGTDAAAAALSAVNAFITAHPATGWVCQYSITTTDQDRASYQAQADELAASLPGGGAAAGVVDGQSTYSRQTDELGRIVGIYDYDLLINEDWQTIVTALRPEGTIVSEEVQLIQGRQTRLQARFVTMGGDDNDLMAWQESFHIIGDQQFYSERRYPGANPILVAEPGGYQHLEQVGSASMAGAYPKEPDAIYPDRLLASPQVVRTRVNATEMRTDWRYLMASPDAITGFDAPIDALARPTAVTAVTNVDAGAGEEGGT